MTSLTLNWRGAISGRLPESSTMFGMGFEKAQRWARCAFIPCKKPVDLMQWCIGRAGAVNSIIDPFTGSGTTLIAAKNLGIPAVGIEIEESYCEIAANRLRQEVFDFSEVQP